MGTTTTYTYDENNTRVYFGSATSSVVYPNRLYNRNATTTKTTHQVFLGDLLVATIESATSTGTSTYFVHTDHLGGTSVITNASGTISQVTDYYPYGGERINTQTNGFKEQRKYAGTELDPDSLYNFMEARYYDSGRGQFISQDPIARDNPNKVLVDPQQLNTYSYARNNPLIFRDSTGKLVELVSRPVSGYTGWIGGHTFLRITPADAASIGKISGIDTGKAFTLGGYSEKPFGTPLTKQANAPSDYKYINADAYGSGRIAGVVVSPPKGMSQADFERKIVEQYNSLPPTLGSYSFVGQPEISGDPNSNNAATSYLKNAGVTSSKINLYQAMLFAGNYKLTPGLGVPYTTASINSRLQGALGQLSSALSSLAAALGKSGSNNTSNKISK